jgi:hypothetical protein
MKTIRHVFDWAAAPPKRQYTLQEALFPKKKWSIPFNRAGRLAERGTMVVGTVAIAAMFLSAGTPLIATGMMVMFGLLPLKINAAMIGGITHACAWCAKMMALSADRLLCGPGEGPAIPWNPEQKNLSQNDTSNELPAVSRMPDPSPELAAAIERAQIKRLFGNGS